MDIAKACKKEILELMRKHNLTQTQVLEIYKAQWKFVKEKMKHDFKKEPIENRASIKLTGLGTFKFNPLRAKYLTLKKIESYERKVQLEEAAADRYRIEIDRDMSQNSGTPEYITETK